MAGKPGRSGGARPGSGPPPAEHSRRKDRAAKAARREPASKAPTVARGKPMVLDDGEWLTLPREGRTSNAPAWPLTKASSREMVLWRREWKRPQALAWELRGVSADTVAFYVRYMAEAEKVEATVGTRNLVARYAAELGLTAAGMRMLRWKIAKPPQAMVEPPSTNPKAWRSVGSARDRLTIVKSDVG